MITIGQEFREERKNQGLSLEEVAKATKIKEEFLRAIEKGDFRVLPSSAYAHGFVRNYAKFLGLPVEKSLAIFRREFDEKKNIEVLPRSFSNPREFTRPRVRFGRSIILIGAIFIIVAGYLFFQYRSAFFNPSLEIMSPSENQTINSLSVKVDVPPDTDSFGIW